MAVPRISSGLLLIFFTPFSNGCVPMKTPTPGIPAKPACARCEANLITVHPADPTDPGSKGMDFVTPGMAGRCLTRTFTCAGSNPVIEINGGASKVTDAASASVEAKCNAAGTAWEFNGDQITQVACTIPCKRCVASDLPITQSDKGMVLSTEASIDRTGACVTWNLMCTGGSLQLWQLTDPAGGRSVFYDYEDGVVDNVVNMLTTCDATGKYFTVKEKNLVKVNCFAGN